MLSKEVCKKCINEYYVEEDLCWVGDDDKEWKQGRIDCPFNESMQSMRTTDKPPSECKYRLEHTVMEEKNVRM